MSHSTLTWFSSQFVPKHTDELFMIAYPDGTVCSLLCSYNSDRDGFEAIYNDNVKCLRKAVGCWAYVPTKIDFHERLDKQSQTPTE